MVAFTAQKLIAGSHAKSRGRATPARRAAVACVTCASPNLSHDAALDDMGALASPRADAPPSVVVNRAAFESIDFSAAANATAVINSGVTVVTVPDDQDPSICDRKTHPLCRDLAAPEFQATSLRFMLPEVRGLSPKSLSIRRNIISTTYTFR